MASRGGRSRRYPGENERSLGMGLASGAIWLLIGRPDRTLAMTAPPRRAQLAARVGGSASSDSRRGPGETGGATNREGRRALESYGPAGGQTFPPLFCPFLSMSSDLLE
jgi:hypothetical protein